MASCSSYIKSQYLLELEKTSKEVAVRYMEKTKMIDVDPYSLGENELSYQFESVPNITTMDIVTYVVLTHSYYTKEQMKAYKSLQAYKYFEAGFVGNIGCKHIKDYVLLISKVQHSMKVREPKLKVWVLTQKDGGVCTAHCMCMAGLGEVCSHIAAVLYAAEHAARLQESITCTDKKSTWPVPSYSGVEPTPVAEIDWGKHSQLKVDVEVPTLDRQGIKALLSKIEQQNCSAALMRVVPPFSEKIAAEKVSLPMPFEIYKKLNEQKSLEELIELGSKIEINVTTDLIAKIEESTRGQRKCEEWYRQRKGRITASIFKRVCRTNVLKPSISLVKSICYPVKISHKLKAINWGITHEDVAVKAYREKIKENHEGLIVNEVGFLLHKQRAWLGATPDRLVYCECCLGGVVEVKCPYILHTGKINLQEFAGTKDTCLELDESKNVSLDKSHAYYYQAQAQIFISNLQYCDFVVWCPSFVFVERVLPDFNFWDENVEKASLFHRNVVMPELLGRYYTAKIPGGDITRWCFCNGVGDSEMVKCDNMDCAISYYHLKCIQDEPSAKDWICPTCNLSMSHTYN